MRRRTWLLRALALFSVEPELLAKDIERATAYRAMNALDHDAPVDGILPFNYC